MPQKRQINPIGERHRQRPTEYHRQQYGEGQQTLTGNHRDQFEIRHPGWHSDSDNRATHRMQIGESKQRTDGPRAPSERGGIHHLFPE